MGVEGQTNCYGIVLLLIGALLLSATEDNPIRKVFEEGTGFPLWVLSLAMLIVGIVILFIIDRPKR